MIVSVFGLIFSTNKCDNDEELADDSVTFFIFIFIAIRLLHQQRLGVGDFFFVPHLFIFVLISDDHEEEARLSPRRFQQQRALFSFLLLPNKDCEEEEAMLTSYPATTKTHCIISRSKAYDSVPFLFFIATR
jgi:hypothetical protein